MTTMFDTHVNLHAEAFDEDREAVIARARAAGVSPILAICSRWSDLASVRALTAAHVDIFGTAGAHPHHAKDEPDITADAIVARADDPKCVAIGETGLDRHYNHSPFADQVTSFRAHIAAARQTGLPLIVHAREADEPMAEILEAEMATGPFDFVLHCYSSGPELAQRGAALGGYFSVNGIMTFKKASDVRAIITDIMPDDRIFLETDSPYLAPVPHRGRRNEPSYLVHVANYLAELKGWSLEDTIARTTANALRLFNKVGATGPAAIAEQGAAP